MIARHMIEADFHAMDAWLRARGEPTPPRDWYGTGFIVDDAAAGFLYGTDAARAYAEDFVTNPAVSRETRHAAIVAVEEAIAAEARKRGFAWLIGFTRVPSMVNVAERCGFEVHGDAFRCVARRL